MAFRGRLPKVIVHPGTALTQDDTTRLKKEMKQTADRLQWGVPFPEKTLDTYVAKADTLKMLRKGAPPGTHKSFAEGVDAFDGTAITKESAPQSPTASIPRGTAPTTSLPSAVGYPAGIQLHDGTDNARSRYQTFEASNSRAESSFGREPSVPQHFNALNV